MDGKVDLVEKLALLEGPYMPGDTLNTGDATASSRLSPARSR